MMASCRIDCLYYCNRILIRSNRNIDEETIPAYAFCKKAKAIMGIIWNFSQM